MAAVLQQATRSSSNAIPRQTTRPEVLSFEKELSYELESLGKLCSRRADTALRQRLSNGLFQLWNKYEASKYETKLSPEFLAEKQLSTGDTLYQAKEYQLASVHCYGRYLRSLEGYNKDRGSDWIVEFCKTSKQTETATFALRAAIGDTASRYYHYLLENPDPHFMFPQTVSQVLSLLRQLQSCSQACLQREAHYWLAYNSVLLTYSISRCLLSTGKVSAALQPLLWASVCTESSVPLLTLRYLRLRVDIYTAVCQCYFQLKEPRHAELFARRGLEKVHQLALLEHQSSSAATEASERVFHEATLKLGVVVFRRSVLESRLTRKTVFRPKKRPTIKELLQQLFPRSPTEKLLVELFPGDAARFLAVLEALAEPCRDPLAKGLPRPITNLDADTTADVIQELLCAGTDLALKSLQHWEDEQETQANDTPHVSLLESAINKSDVIPLVSILRYVRMALSYDQREVCDLLLDRALGVAGRSPEPAVARHLVCIRLLMAVEGVRGAGGKRVTLPGGAESQHALVTQEHGDKLLNLSSLLHSACQNPALQEWERDLLQDSVLFLWDTVRPAVSQLHSHHFNTTRPLTSSRRGKEYAGVMEQLVDMTDWLGLWRPHPLICGELVMKLSCLKESLASRPYRHTPSGAGEGFAGENDRDVLLETQSLLERGLRWTHLFRSSCTGGKEDPVAMMHGELCYALTRVKVKLAATIPPPATPEPSLKPSSLHRKMRERQEKAERRDILLSSLPATSTPVPSLADLKTHCGQNHYSLALLSMLEAALAPPQLTPAQRTNLLNEALSSLQQLDNEQGLPRSLPLPVSSPSPPPPLLLHQTPTSLTFMPAPWNPPHNQQVAYYRLYGRVAEGSNVKVRLSDKAFPGLGTEVSAGPNCQLKARDLKPNTLYVFAVAAYSKNGELFGRQTGQLSGLSHQRTGQTSGHSSGGSIGETGRPIVSCHALPLLPAWSYLCQCAFVAGGEEVALKAARTLWNRFVETGKSDTTPGYRLKSTALTSTPSTLLHHFVYSVFIHTHLTSPPLPSSPHHRPHNKETTPLSGPAPSPGPLPPPAGGPGGVRAHPGALSLSADCGDGPQTPLSSASERYRHTRHCQDPGPVSECVE
ncbi:Cilia- and flagella-associated protein 54 [Geodia barretti]|uniref:Cilia- and flagella-associated protein 54 n=1 Tax=Geodia barretti TaxID=519541 RepID=A0AA35W0M4_GEOBA|nr:Cilia- and flagella-associated protein 54 [Geodia barretti]